VIPLYKPKPPPPSQLDGKYLGELRREGTSQVEKERRRGPREAESYK